MPSRLTDMEYDEVSVVDRGANQDSHIVLFKRDGGLKGLLRKAKGGKGQGDAGNSNSTGADAGACPECGTDMTGVDACPECGYKVKAKVKKDEADDVVDDDSDDLDGDEDEDDEDDEDDDEDDDDLDDDEDDESESDDEPDVVKNDLGELDDVVRGEVLDFSIALSDSIGKILNDPTIDQSRVIKRTLAEFVTVTKAASQRWIAGDTISKNDTRMNEGRIARLRKMRSNIDSVLAEQSPEGEEMAIDKNALSDDVREYVESLEKKVEGLSKADDTNSDEVIFKGMTPEAVSIVKKAQADAEAAQETLRKRDEEELTKSLTGSVTSFKNLAMNTEETVAVLKSLDAESRQKMLDTLKAANEQASAAALFSSVGKSIAAGADVITKVDVLAKEKVAKGEHKSIEEARSALFSEQPSLYDEYESAKAVR